jgi:hypothetical protein
LPNEFVPVDPGELEARGEATGAEPHFSITIEILGTRPGRDHHSEPEDVWDLGYQSVVVRLITS